MTSYYSNLLVDAIYHYIDKKLEQIYNDIVCKSCCDSLKFTTFEEFICQVVDEVFSQDMEKHDVLDLKNNTFRNKQKMKKRWYDSLVKDINKKSKKSLILNEMDKYKVFSKDELKRFFNVDTIDELIDIRLNEIKKWVEDKEAYLCDFYYFSLKNKSQIYSAFRNDIILEIIRIINENFNGSITGYISERAADLVENPVFATGKSLLKLVEGLDTVSNSPIYYNDYYVTEDYVLRTFIRTPEKVKLHQWYVLDEKDSRIIDLIYDKVKPSFYKDRTVEIAIRDIAKYVYDNINSFSYKDAEDRIMKLAAYNVMGIIKAGENIRDTKFSINFFDHAVIYTDANGRRIAKIVFGEILHNKYIQNKTIKAVSYKLNKIENPISKLLFYPLQKEILEMGVSEDSDYIGEYNYLYFRHRIRFKTKSKKTNIKLIQEGLEHLKKKEVLVEDYQLEGDTFIIKFYPLSEAEKKAYGLIP